MSLTLSAADITEREIQAVTAVLRSGRLSLGPWMEEFEQRLAAQVRLPFGIAVSSGTAGLHLCLVALGIGEGDEVIVPSFSFVAVANCVRYVGATPIFADIEASSLNLDPASVERAVTARTRAMIVVHTFGRPANLRRLLALANRHRLRLIEDACEALGASYAGAQVGSFGDAGVFGFYPNKQITTGEGGMIVTADPGLATKLRALRNQGRYPTDAWHQHSLLGFNYRLSEMQCALGAAQMERLPEILAGRAAVAELYSELLREDTRIELPAPCVSAPFVGEDTLSWFVYVIRLRLSTLSLTRDAVAQSMARDGVPTGRYFAPIHQQPAYRNRPWTQPLPVTERESVRTLALPFFTKLREDDVQTVVKSLRNALDQDSE